MFKRVNAIIIISISSLLLGGCTNNKNVISDEKEDIISQTLTSENTEISNSEVYVADYNNPAGDGKLYINMLGLQQYDGFGEGDLVDKPQKGNKYLVLYLELRNYAEEPYYFNPGLLSVRIDGETIPNTFLVNDPEGYVTAFSEIYPTQPLYGYIVWEVPENWNSFELSYTRWEEQNSSIFQADLTRNDLRDPIIEDNTTFIDE